MCCSLGGSRCKTCKHLVVGNSFASNVRQANLIILVVLEGVSVVAQRMLFM